MLNKRGKIKISLIFVIVLFIVFLSFQGVSAGPYGYGNTMNLRYKVLDEKIIYGYGNGIKYETSLKPRNVDLGEWKPESRRKPLYLSWNEIFEKNESKQKETNESLYINRKLSEYGNILVEKSVLDAFDMDYTEIRVVITVNESINDVDIIKGEIISNLLEDEFELTHNLENSEWFSGNLNKEGLEKLKITNEIIKISKSKGGKTALFQTVSLINATYVQENLGYSGKDQTVCVIDSGVNASHPSLQGKVIAEKCYCRYPEGANPSCCPDGTAIDDNAEDNTGHGTHVAGIIVSQDSTYTGVAPNASIVAVKVCNSTMGRNLNL